MLQKVALRSEMLQYVASFSQGRCHLNLGNKKIH